MKGIHRYNLQCSSLMIVLYVIMRFLGLDEPLFRGLIFGYIYACFMMYIYDLTLPEDKK